MIIGKTTSGFEFSINEKALDNMELVDALAGIEENVLSFSKVVKLLLGEEQKKALYDFLRDEDGIVPSGKVSEAISEILEAGGKPAKNS